MRAWNKKRKPKHHTKLKYKFSTGIKSIYCRQMDKRLKLKKLDKNRRELLKIIGAKEKTIRYVHLGRKYEI